jgi:hypothetical protein
VVVIATPLPPAMLISHPHWLIILITPSHQLSRLVSYRSLPQPTSLLHSIQTPISPSTTQSTNLFIVIKSISTLNHSYPSQIHRQIRLNQSSTLCSEPRPIGPPARSNLPILILLAYLVHPPPPAPLKHLRVVPLMSINPPSNLP